MRQGTGSRLTQMGVALLLLAVAPGSGLSGQEVEVTRETCRCIDSTGAQIEECRCLRAIDPGDLFGTLMRAGESRVRIGVYLSSDQQDAGGARIESVVEDGPAARAGLRAGDIITRIGDQSLLETPDDEPGDFFAMSETLPVRRLLAIVGALEPEEEVEVEFLRDGQLQTAMIAPREDASVASIFLSPNWDEDAIHVRMRDLRDRLSALGEAQEGLRLRLHLEDAPRVRERAGVMEWDFEGGDARGFVVSMGPGDGRFMECPGSQDVVESGWTAVSESCVGGLDLMELKPGLADYFGTTSGVLVADVHADSPTGLEAGDVIVRIGDRAVDTPRRVRTILRSFAADEDVVFHVVRRGEDRSVTGRLGR